MESLLWGAGLISAWPLSVSCLESLWRASGAGQGWTLPVFGLGPLSRSYNMN